MVDAQVHSGAPWPWAGALRTLGSQPWEPVSLEAFESLELHLRGSGTVQVLFFSGASPQSLPAVRPVALDGGWFEARIPLGEVPGLERGRVRAIAVVAGPAPGDRRFEIASADLR